MTAAFFEWRVIQLCELANMQNQFYMFTAMGFGER